MIYSIEQNEQVVDMLERRLKVVLSGLNEKLKYRIEEYKQK